MFNLLSIGTILRFFSAAKPYLIGLASVATIGWLLYDAVYDKGYADAALEISQKQYEQAIADQAYLVAESKRQMSILEADHIDALNRAKAEREIITRIEKETEYVEIKVPVGCDKLAYDVVGMRRNATAIINRAAKGEYQF